MNSTAKRLRKLDWAIERIERHKVLNHKVQIRERATMDIHPGPSDRLMPYLNIVFEPTMKWDDPFILATIGILRDFSTHKRIVGDYCVEMIDETDEIFAVVKIYKDNKKAVDDLISSVEQGVEVRGEALQ